MDSSSSSTPPPPPWDSLLDELKDQAFSFLPAAADRGAVAAVCKRWRDAERHSRRRLTVHNCYAVAPGYAVQKFPSVRAAVVKGMPHFADFGCLPPDWGAFAEPWVAAAAQSWPLLEELSFKRMVVTDQCLHMIASSFSNLQVLRINRCMGFSTTGLAAITQACRNLREIDLEESSIDNNNTSSHWLSNFSESLETLNLSCLSWEVNFTLLERLVSRCRNLKTLKLNNDIPPENVTSLLSRAPQITELGFGKFSADHKPDLLAIQTAFAGCRSLRRLSGGWNAVLPAFSCVCEGLTSLNLCYATVPGRVLKEFIRKCTNLLQLWVNDLIGDRGLAVVASSCSKLKDLRVVPAKRHGYRGPDVSMRERGLVAVSAQCPRLETVLYMCSQMTNRALITVARNRPNMTSFRLGIFDPDPDYITKKPFDVGVRAIMESCRGLRRLSIAALLTDAGLRSIGEHDSVEVLSLAYTGDSDLGLHYILSGCKSLKRLQITDCPFVGMALLANAAKLETLRYLWMSSCKVTVVACRLLGFKMPRLTVEVINAPPRETDLLESLPPNFLIDSLYVYRTLAGPRSDAPQSIQIAYSN